MSHITINEEILAADLGEGWKDQFAAAEAYAAFLARRYHAAIAEVFPEATIEVQIEVHRHAYPGGMDSSIQVNDLYDADIVEAVLEPIYRTVRQEFLAAPETDSLRA